MASSEGEPRPDGDGPRAVETLAAIRALLDSEGIEYRHIEHVPTRTSEESAAARGEPLEIGGKALVLRVDGRFVLLVLSASSRLDSRAVKRTFSARSVRFATSEELLELTGLVPGSVPPFGPPILPIELHLDESVLRHRLVAFNAGSLRHSIVLATADFVRVSAGERVRVTS